MQSLFFMLKNLTASLSSIDKKRASEEEEEKEAHISHLTKNSSRPYAKLGWTSKKNGHISKFRRYEI